MFCAECGAPKMRRTDEPITDTFKGTEITVRGVAHWVCDSCGETVFSADDLKDYAEAENAAFREMHGLLSPSEIRAIREDHGLTQAQFEAVLGVKSPTVSRWETGAVVQTKPIDSLMRMFRNHQCVADDLLQRAELARRTPEAMGACITFKKMRDALTQERIYTYDLD